MHAITVIIISKEYILAITVKKRNHAFEGEWGMVYGQI